MTEQVNMTISYDKWRTDLKSVPKKEQRAWIKRTLKSKRHLHIFGRYFFPEVIKGKSDVPGCHMDLLAELSTTKHSGIIFPRGFAKSTWEKIDTIHDIVYNLEPVILYIGVTLTDAKFHFNSIKNELDGNDLLIAIFGHLRSIATSDTAVKWNDSHFRTSNGVDCVARGSCKGRGVNINGQRPTKIILDDIENDELVRSSERRIKLHEWLVKVIFPSKDKVRGKIKMIGTLLHEHCELTQFHEKHGGIKRKAIEDGKSIWPNYWSLDDLEKERDSMGTRAFMQEYMNEPSSSDLANINHLWIDDHVYSTLPKMNNIKKVITIDPQAGETGLSDEYAITVVTWDKISPHRYVEEQIAGRGSKLKQCKDLVLAWHRHRDRCGRVGVEKILGQVAVFQLVIAWKNREIEIDGLEHIADRNIPISAINPGGKDKVTRLEKHEPSFERGEIHLRPEMKTLRDQILFLGSKYLEHDDRADSLVMALDLSFKQKVDSMLDEVYNEQKDSTIGGNLYDEEY